MKHQNCRENIFFIDWKQNKKQDKKTKQGNSQKQNQHRKRKAETYTMKTKTKTTEKITSQNGTFGCKSAILGRGLERGFYYLWYLKAVLCWKHFFIVFSAKHSFAELKECNLKKQKFTKKKGLFAEMQKGVFLVCFFLVVLFFSSVFLCLCFVKKAQKGYFPAFLEVFKILFPRKACL